MSSNLQHRIACLAALATLAVAAIIPAATGADPGGAVNNKDPTVDASSSTGSVNQAPGTGLFTVEVRDRNGEDDMVDLKVELTAGPVAVSATHAITAGEATASDPGTYALGWTVWNSGGNGDGRMTFVYKHAYTVAGTYTWRFSVRDSATGSYFFDAARDITVVIGAAITVAVDPVKLDGSTDTGARWGGWSADPGATLVPSTNYIKVTNTGVTAAQSFTLAFSGASFVGQTTPAYAVPINNNVRFRTWEDTTPATTSPAEAGTALDCTAGAASATGAVTPSFSSVGSILYIRYCIVAIPDPMKDQTYSQAFTVTAV